MANALAPPQAPDVPQPVQSAGPPQPGGAPPQQMPAPTHAQTVAALRHFQAVMTELRGLLKDPDLGKSNLKSKIIDGATKLVSARIIQPSQAVMQLANVPERPFEQKRWLEQQYLQAVQASDFILDHHRSANPATGDIASEMGAARGSPDDHMTTMSGLMQAHYPGGARA